MLTTMEQEGHTGTAAISPRYLAALAAALVASAAAIAAVELRSAGSADRPVLLQRPARASAIVQPFAAGAAVRRDGRKRAVATCRRPGPTNHLANCKSDGLPALEPTLATNGRLIVGAAADYNSYNGRPQLGFYWSRDGQRWFDGGPLDLFPRADANAAGDPLIAIDAAGTVYYAGMLFSYTRCDVGGIELLRRDPRSGTWARRQLAANGAGVLQDRPGLALAGDRIVVVWSRFESCEGSAVPSRLKATVLPTGPATQGPFRVLDVPGSTFSQGAAPAGDGLGGFWLAWEEFPDATAVDGAIRLARWRPGRGWEGPRTISPPGFRDLPDPLPGFRVDTTSLPAISVVRGRPYVVWASAETGRGRVTLWTPDGATVLHDRGGDQLLPAVAADARGGVFVAFSSADAKTGRIDRLLWHAGRVTRISSAPTHPASDAFFGGRFLGWVSGLTVFRGRPLATWPDLRRGSSAFSAMTALAG